MAVYSAGNLTDWVRKCDRRMKAVTRDATQRVVSEAIEPGPTVGRPTSFGTGKMPVDTGFLRNTTMVSFGSVPTGPSTGERGVDYPEPNFDLKLAGWTGGTIYVGWTAAYARAMERKYGFARSAGQNWSRHVTAAAKDAKRRFG